MTDPSRVLCESLSRVLMRCWIMGFVLLLIWLGAILLFKESILEMHGSLFGVSKHELDLVMYCGLGLFKLGVITLFFLPWLSLRMELRRQGGNPR